MNRPDYAFLLDETASNDHITARFPRTSREAFGHHHPQPRLQHHLTFLPRQRGGWLGLLVAAAILAAFALA